MKFIRNVSFIIILTCIFIIILSCNIFTKMNETEFDNENNTSFAYVNYVNLNRCVYLNISSNGEYLYTIDLDVSDFYKIKFNSETSQFSSPQLINPSTVYHKFSADGLFQFQYSASNISTYKIDPSTYEEDYQSTFTLPGPAGYTWYPDMAPDGKNLYLPHFDTDIIHCLQIDTHTGEITGDNTVDTLFMDDVYYTAVSPEGKHVYACGGPSAGIGLIKFTRNLSDGSLTSPSSSYQTGTVRHITLSKDGRYLYATGTRPGVTSNYIQIYSRDSINGSLTNIGSIAAPSDVIFLNCSYDGNYLYAGTTGGPPDYFLSYKISNDGRLKEVYRYTNGTLDDIRYIEISPDDKHIFAASTDSGQIYLFKRY